MTHPKISEAKRKSNPIEDELAFQIRATRMPKPERQYRYAPPRKFAADFAWPAQRLLVEVQGGIWTRQAHGSIKGVLADIDRLNAATLAGWRLLRFTPEMVKSGAARMMIDEALFIDT